MTKMRKIFAFICIMISLTACTAVQAYAEEETETDAYLRFRENKEFPDMTHPEMDGIVVFQIDADIYKNIDEMLNKYIEDYYYYDDRTDMLYYEAGKKKPFLFIADSANITNREEYYIVAPGVEKTYKEIKEVIDDDAIYRVDSDIIIYNKYYFNFGGYLYEHWAFAYYETNLGNYVYVWEKQRFFGDCRKYLMSFDNFMEYVEKLRIYNNKFANGSGDEVGSSGTRNPFDLSIFDSNSPDFNPDARIEDVLYPGRRIARIIIITCMAAVAITVGVVVIKRKKKNITS